MYDTIFGRYEQYMILCIKKTPKPGPPPTFGSERHTDSLALIWKQCAEISVRNTLFETLLDIAYLTQKTCRNYCQ